LLGTPHHAKSPAGLKAELTIPTAAAGHHFTLGLTVAISTPDEIAVPGTRVVVVARAGTSSAASHSSRPGAKHAATGTHPAAGTANAQAEAARLAGSPVSPVSIAGAPLPPGLIAPPTGPGLDFPTVKPGQNLAPSLAHAKSPGSVSAVSDRIPLTVHQLELQAGELGLLAIALIITFARVSVRGLVPPVRSQLIRFLRSLPGLRADGSGIRPDGPAIRPDGPGIRPEGSGIRPDGNASRDVTREALPPAAEATSAALRQRAS
jgi:hypothetical protein